MHQGPAGPAVSIDKGVNRLKLGVGDGGLLDRGEVVPVAEGRKVVEKSTHVLGGGRHVVSRKRVVRRSADPVLPRPHDAAELLYVRLPAEGAMDVADCLDRDGRATIREGDRV